jgi:hypothetical protein
MSMAWRIFRKDFKLLWPLGLASAALQLTLALLRYQSDPLGRGHDFSALSALITLALIVSMCLLVVLAVQQESIPGVNQDWLVRPIKRRDLLLAKVLMVVLLIHGPIIVGNSLRGVAEGFGAGSLLGASLLSNFEIALVFSLPLLAIAALTRSLAEALVGALLVFLGLLLLRLLVLALLFPFTHVFHFETPTEDTGVAWVWTSLSHTVLLLVMISVLWLQYFRRNTAISRALFIAGLFVVMLLPELPWQPAFALQRWIGGRHGATASIAVSFDPGVARVSVPPNSAEDKESHSKEVVRILLPLRVAGVPAGFLLHTDRAEVRLTGQDGGTLYLGAARLDAQNPLHQEIEIPADQYARISDQALQLQADYSLTLLQKHTLPFLSAPNGRRALPGLGQCASRLRTGESTVEVACRAVGDLPPCVSMELEQVDQASRHPEQFECDENYEPRFLQFSVESINRLSVKLPFANSGDGQARDARIVISVYDAKEHFTRPLAAVPFRLSEWRVTDAK